LLVSGQAFTVEDITTATDTAIANDDFFQSAYRYRDKFKNNTRVNSYRRTKTIINKLKQHSPKLKFNDIDISFIHRYELYLKSLGNSVNTIKLNLSVIRTIYRAAIKSGIVTQLHDPFIHYKFKLETTQRLLKEQMSKN
jgi:site-specific recombinase XerD